MRPKPLIATFTASCLSREEACATIEIDRLLAMYSVARIGQVQIMYRARLVSADVAAGPESEEAPWHAS